MVTVRLILILILINNKRWGGLPYRKGSISNLLNQAIIRIQKEDPSTCGLVLGFVKDRYYLSSGASRGHVVYFSVAMAAEFTEEQLRQYNGTDSDKPIYVAIKGRVFDVSSGKNFYGPGGSYAVFAGRDASRALAKMSKNEEDVNGSLDGLTEKEIAVLEDWEKKFEAKYPVVGRVA